MTEIRILFIATAIVAAVAAIVIGVAGVNYIGATYDAAATQADLSSAPNEMMTVVNYLVATFNAAATGTTPAPGARNTPCATAPGT